jgi:hypothetical protein
MSELPPDLAVESEPTDSDPPPEAVRPDRPRIWPEEPRAPRPQIKRPMEEWLAEFEARVREQPVPARDQGTRRRRPRGLARILPVAPPPRTERPRPDEVPAQPSEPRRGRRRRRGSGRGQEQGQPADSALQQARPPRTGQRRGPRSGRRDSPRGGTPGAANATPRRDRPSPPSSQASPGPPRDGEGGFNRRRRRRGRGRGRGPQPGGGSNPSRGPSSPPPSAPPPG